MLLPGFKEFFDAHDAHDIGVLKSVWSIRRSEELTGDDILSQEDLELLVLIFEHATLTLRAVGEDDTLEITSSSRPSWPKELRSDVSKKHPWSKLLGQRLSWAWSLTDHRGYANGLMIELAPAGGHESSQMRILVEVVASRFRLYLVAPAYM